MGTTRQYLAGELSVLLGHLQAVTTTEAAGRDAWSLRHAAETEPIPILRLVTVRALALTEGLCWDSLNWGDTAAFSRQAAQGGSGRPALRSPNSYSSTAGAGDANADAKAELATSFALDVLAPTNSCSPSRPRSCTPWRPAGLAWLPTPQLR